MVQTINRIIKKFSSVYQFCNGDINKFVLLLRKGVYRYEYIDSWERFNKTSLPNKKSFYSKPRILESSAGCRTMFLFAVFCNIGALERNPIDFMSN